MSYIYHHVDVIRVIDGDTIVLSIDVGNRMSWQPKRGFRLAGINTPERSEPGFTTATDRLKVLVANGISRVETYKEGKYGRWSIDIWVAITGGEMLVNQQLITEGYAVAYPS